jgi:hypothetical protein
MALFRRLYRHLLSLELAGELSNIAEKRMKIALKSTSYIEIIEPQLQH